MGQNFFKKRSKLNEQNCMKFSQVSKIFKRGLQWFLFSKRLLAKWFLIKNSEHAQKLHTPTHKQICMHAGIHGSIWSLYTRFNTTFRGFRGFRVFVLHYWIWGVFTKTRKVRKPRKPRTKWSSCPRFPRFPSFPSFRIPPFFRVLSTLKVWWDAVFDQLWAVLESSLLIELT